MPTKLKAFRIDADLLKQLQHAAVDLEITEQELLARAIEAYLKTIAKKSPKKK
jgi:predicted transcriptional regulator